MTADFHVDDDETGAVCSIELLNANQHLAAGDDGKLFVVNGLRREEVISMNVARPPRSPPEP